MTIHKRRRLFPEIQRDTRTAKNVGEVKSNARFTISPVASVRAVSMYPDPNHSCVGASLVKSLAPCSARKHGVRRENREDNTKSDSEAGFGCLLLRRNLGIFPERKESKQEERFKM